MSSPSSCSPFSSYDQPADDVDIPVHPAFDHADADFCIVSKATPSCPSKVFRVHKANMKVHSTIFSDMFDMPQTRNSPPVLPLEEDADTVALLFPFIYNLPAPPLPLTRELLFNVRDAAEKYDINSAKNHLDLLMITLAGEPDYLKAAGLVEQSSSDRGTTSSSSVPWWWDPFTRYAYACKWGPKAAQQATLYKALYHSLLNISDTTIEQMGLGNYRTLVELHYCIITRKIGGEPQQQWLARLPGSVSAYFPSDSSDFAT